MPLIYAAKHSSQRERILSIFSKKQKGEEEVREVIGLVSACGGIRYAEDIAEKHIAEAKKAVEIIEDRELREVYHQIADFILTRNQ